MHSARAGIHLHASQRCANNSSRDPNAQIRGNVTSWIRNPESLHNTRKKRHQPRRRKRSRPITTELRGTGQLPAYAADVAKRSIEIVHGKVTLHCKVTQEQAEC